MNEVDYGAGCDPARGEHDAREAAAAGRAPLPRECLGHTNSLYRTALRMTRHPEEAEDLVQETYVKALRGAPLYNNRPQSGCKAWLFRILTNAFVDRYRRARRAPVAVEIEEDGRTGVYDLLSEGPLADDTYDPFRKNGLDVRRDPERFLATFVSDEVKQALEEVPETFRRVVLLRDVEALSYREIATIIGVPIGTVMSRLFRGRRLLREKLLEYGRARGYASAPGDPSRSDRRRAGREPAMSLAAE